MAILESCTIKFYTNGAGKKADSRVTVTVRDDNNVIAAFADNEFGRFEEHSNNGPFALSVMNAGQKADIRRGSVTIRFSPTGDDLWRFNFFTVFTFSDGTRLSGGEVDLELNRSRNEQISWLDVIIR